MTPIPRFELLGARTGNCLRVAVALEVLGLPCRITRIDLRAGEHRSPTFRRLNPVGRVPVLIDHADPLAPFVLTQSNAILLHLCDAAPGVLLPLAPGPQRARVLERYFYFVTDVIAVGGSSFTLTTGGEAAAGESLMQRALQAIGDAETFLDPGPFLAGEAFSLADVVALTILDAYADRVAWADLPRLADWFGQVTARDDVRRGLAAFSTG